MWLIWSRLILLPVGVCSLSPKLRQPGRNFRLGLTKKDLAKCYRGTPKSEQTAQRQRTSTTCSSPPNHSQDDQTHQEGRSYRQVRYKVRLRNPGAEPLDDIYSLATISTISTSGIPRGPFGNERNNLSSTLFGYRSVSDAISNQQHGGDERRTGADCSLPTDTVLPSVSRSRRWKSHSTQDTSARSAERPLLDATLSESGTASRARRPLPEALTSFRMCPS